MGYGVAALDPTLRQADPPCSHGGQTRDLGVRSGGEGFWRNAPLYTPSFEMLKPRNCRSSGLTGALFTSFIVSRSFLVQKTAHRGHHPLTGATAANIDVAWCSALSRRETVTPSGWAFLLGVVEREVLMIWLSGRMASKRSAAKEITPWFC